MCQRVSHPHLAWTYEVGKWRQVHYIAMEYIPGKSLYRLVHDEGPIAVPRLARLFGEVCLALDHAHNQGLIHRDLKPSNIIVTPNDHAKVLDLGLALMEGEIKGEREVIGGEGYVVGTMDYIRRSRRPIRRRSIRAAMFTRWAAPSISRWPVARPFLGGRPRRRSSGTVPKSRRRSPS